MLKRSHFPLQAMLLCAALVTGCQTCLRFQPKVDGGETGSGGAGGSAGGASTGGSNGGGTAGGRGGSGGGVVEGLAVENYCKKRSEAQCAYRVACGILEPGQQADCNGRRTATCEGDELPGKVRAGVLQYDGKAAEKCLAAYAGANCSGVVNLLAPETITPECARVWTRSGATGQNCASGTCVNSQCKRLSLGSCPVCIPFQRVGDGCDGGSLCDPDDAFCELQPSSGGPPTCVLKRADGTPCPASTGNLHEHFQCRSGRCSVRLADGGLACGVPPNGARCLHPDDCATTQFCAGLRFQKSGALSLAGTCQPRIAIGQSCSNFQVDDGCVDGGSCLDGGCSPKLLGGRNLDQECDEHQQCNGNQFCEGLGNFTSVGDVDFYVFADGGPSMRAGNCALRGDAGVVCTTDVECLLTHRCKSGRCAPRLVADSTCQSVNDCKMYLLCMDGGSDIGNICRTNLKLGDSCSAASNCLSPAQCADSSGGTATVCVNPLPNSSPCKLNLDCGSKRCEPISGSSVCFPSCFP